MKFEPMPRRSTGTLTQAAQSVSSAVGQVEAMREPHAQFWDEWNAAAAAESGPLWLAVGDSSTQGIGAPDPMDGWVPQVLQRLREATNDPWRVINLAITGGQFSDLVEHQLPRIDLLEDAGQMPEFCTLIAGANNLMAPGSWRGANGQLTTILQRLPERSVVARVGISSPFNSYMARKFTNTIEKVGTERDFELFWPWDWPERDGMAGDKFHPSTIGYGYMTDIIWDRVQASLTKGSYPFPQKGV